MKKLHPRSCSKVSKNCLPLLLNINKPFLLRKLVTFCLVRVITFFILCYWGRSLFTSPSEQMLFQQILLIERNCLRFSIFNSRLAFGNVSLKHLSPKLQALPAWRLVQVNSDIELYLTDCIAQFSEKLLDWPFFGLDFLTFWNKFANWNLIKK